MKESREELEQKYGISLNPSDVRKRVIRNVLVLSVFGIIYYFVVRYTPLSMKCYIYEIFGVKCPACGATRMMLSLARFDLKKAFLYNPFLLVTLPYVVTEVIYFFYLNESKKSINKINQIVLFIWVGAFILFGILRNIL